MYTCQNCTLKLDLTRSVTANQSHTPISWEVFQNSNNFRYFIFLSVLSTITRIRPIADWWQIKTNHYFVQSTNFSIEEVRDSVFFGYLITQNDCQSNSGFVLYFQKCSLLTLSTKTFFLMAWRLNAANFLKIINFPWRLEPSRLDRSSSKLR